MGLSAKELISKADMMTVLTFIVLGLGAVLLLIGALQSIEILTGVGISLINTVVGFYFGYEKGKKTG